jgi:hypothetical protein
MASANIMNDDIKLDEVNKNIKRLLQIQDFTTLQTTVLGIAFALIIFGVSGLIYDIAPIYKLVSAIMLFVLIPLLMDILISIFSNNWEVKLDFFIKALFLVLIVSISLISLFVIYGFYIWLSFPFEDTPAMFISWILIVSLITFFIIFKLINPLYRKRFNEIYIQKVKDKPVKGLISYLDSVIEKRMPRIAFSLMAGSFLTLIFGYFETTPYGEIENRFYGIPFQWLKYPVNSSISTFDYPYFVLDMFIFTTIVFSVITLWDWYRLKKK